MRGVPHRPVTVVGRYEISAPVASGGMASVHIGKLLGDKGFRRIVAVKRPHENIARDVEFRDMLIDEARIAVRVRHPNVVSTLDLVVEGKELLLVMEYIHGESVARLTRLANEPMPLSRAIGIMSGVLRGLHAAHEARGLKNEPLDIVHRDVSPQNILVGVDGVARVVDFGVAKAFGRLHATRTGEIKGKLAYMSPEQLRDAPLNRQSDVYSASVVLWEMLTGRRIHEGVSDIAEQILLSDVVLPSRWAPGVPASLDAIVARGLAYERRDRFSTALQMAVALEGVVTPAKTAEIGAWVETLAVDSLAQKTLLVESLDGSHSERTLTGVCEPESHKVDKRHWSRAHGWGLAGAALTLFVIVIGVQATTARVDHPLAAVESQKVETATLDASEPPPLGVAQELASSQSDVTVSTEVESLHPSSVPTAQPRSGNGPSSPKIRSIRAAGKACDPPYNRDATGKKTYKLECL